MNKRPHPSFAGRILKSPIFSAEKGIIIPKWKSLKRHKLTFGHLRMNGSKNLWKFEVFYRVRGLVIKIGKRINIFFQESI